MKKILRPALAGLGGTLGTVGLLACDAPARPEVPLPPPAESRAIDADGALTRLLEDENAYARASKLGVLLPLLGPDAVPEVKQILGDRTLEIGATEIELMVRFWATHEPEEASRWAVDESPRGYRIAAVLSAFPAWAEADPRAAASAAQQWSSRRDVRDALQIALVLGWFERDPDELAEFIHRIGMGFPRQRSLLTFIRTMVRKRGIEAAVEWAEAVPGDDATYKNAVYRQMAAVLSLYDLDAAMRWCEDHCDGPYGKSLRELIAQRWAMRDGAAAFAWLSTAPEGYEKDLAVRFVLASWGEADREAALAWMAPRTTPEIEPWLEPALPVYARLLAWNSPADAIGWAERIEDEVTRDAALVVVNRIWRGSDEAAAEAWLAESGLDAEARKKARVPWPQRPSSGG